MEKEGTYLIVVDDDINIRNPFEVEWVLSFRSQPAQDITIYDDVLAIGLGPSTAPVDAPHHDPRRKVGSKVFIDATRKHAYPAISRPSQGYLGKALEHWGDYGF